MRLLSFFAVLAACSSNPDSATPPVIATAPLPVEAPSDNPSTPAKVALGRLLFWDPILSGDRDVACASCHHPDFAYSDGASISTGTGGRAATRNSLTVLDTAWNGVTDTIHTPDPSTAPMFWDERTTSLESQAKGPLTTLTEMRGSAFDETTIMPELVSRLSAIPDYADRFQSAFGAVTEQNIVAAIASFERTLVDRGSSYERWVEGDKTALTASQQRGLNALSANGCTGCHSGPMFTDWTKHELRNGAFRTPSLRNVSRTGPWLHDGSIGTLDDIFDLYRQIQRGRNADPKIRTLDVPNGGERNDVVAFLGALSDGTYDRSVPASVPSGLTVGGRRP